MALWNRGLGVAMVTTNTLGSSRSRPFENLSPRKTFVHPAGHRASRAAEKQLAVFIEELRHAARGVA